MEEDGHSIPRLIQASQDRQEGRRILDMPEVPEFANKLAAHTASPVAKFMAPDQVALQIKLSMG